MAVRSPLPSRRLGPTPHRKLGRAVLTPAPRKPSGPSCWTGSRSKSWNLAPLTDCCPAGAVHQGAALEARPLKSRDLGEILEESHGTPPDGPGAGPAVRPHNVGAILRTAAAFGVTARWWFRTAMPRPSPGRWPSAASGALDLIPHVEVVNIARTLDELAERGFWRIALAGDGESSLAQAVPDRRCRAGAGIGRRRHPPAWCGNIAKSPLSSRSPRRWKA